MPPWRSAFTARKKAFLLKCTAAVQDAMIRHIANTLNAVFFDVASIKNVKIIATIAM